MNKNTDKITWVFIFEPNNTKAITEAKIKEISNPEEYLDVIQSSEIETINIKIVLVNRKNKPPTTHFILDNKELYSIEKGEDLHECISKIVEAKPRKVVVFHDAKEPYENIVNLFLKYREKYKVKCKIYLDGIEIV